jgi:hypothetical protein
MIDITPIAEALIALLATLITMKVIPWLKMRLTLQQQELLNAATRTLVFAAEQIYGTGAGAKKLEYVQRGLEERGFTVDMAVIEAAVKQYTQA